MLIIFIISNNVNTIKGPESNKMINTFGATVLCHVRGVSRFLGVGDLHYVIQKKVIVIL